MKALCVKQPWAQLIQSKRKILEIRTWATKYRGPLLILASAQPSRDSDSNRWTHVTDSPETKRGGSICLTNLVEINDPQFYSHISYELLSCCSSLGPKDLAWELRNTIPVPFIPFKGRLGLFDVPRDWLIQLGNHPDITCEALKRLMSALAA